MAAVRNFKVKSAKFNTSIHILEAFANVTKGDHQLRHAVSRPFIRPFAIMERVNSRLRDFREILYLEVQKIQDRLRSDTSSMHFTQKYKIG